MWFININRTYVTRKHSHVTNKNSTLFPDMLHVHTQKLWDDWSNFILKATLKSLSWALTCWWRSCSVSSVTCGRTRTSGRQSRDASPSSVERKARGCVKHSRRGKRNMSTVELGRREEVLGWGGVPGAHPRSKRGSLCVLCHVLLAFPGKVEMCFSYFL